MIIFHFSLLISNAITELANNYFSGLDLDIIVTHMADTSSHGGASANQSVAVTTTTTTTRTVKDVYAHGSWPDTVRTIFIYGTGALRYVAKKTPSGRIAVTAGTIAMDFGSQITKRVIDDPTWFTQHLSSWKMISGRNNNPEELHVEAGEDKEALTVIDSSPSAGGDTTASFLPSNVNHFFGNNNYDLEGFINFVIQTFKLETVTVDYPQTLLADQHQGLALALFILSLSAIIIFISLIFSVIIFTLRDRIKSYFKNKYILGYLNLNFKIIVIEFFTLSFLLLYDLCYIVKIGHFLFTHPIILK